MGRWDRDRRKHIRQVNVERMRFCLDETEYEVEDDDIDSIFRMIRMTNYPHPSFLFYASLDNHPHCLARQEPKKKQPSFFFRQRWRYRRLGPKRLVHLPPDTEVARFNSMNHMLGVVHRRYRMSLQYTPQYEWIEYANRMESIVWKSE